MVQPQSNGSQHCHYLPGRSVETPHAQLIVNETLLGDHVCFGDIQIVCSPCDREISWMGRHHCCRGCGTDACTPACMLILLTSLKVAATVGNVYACLCT